MIPTTSDIINSFLANNFSDVGTRSPIPPSHTPFTLPSAVTASEESDEAALNDKRREDQKQQSQLRQFARQQTLKDLTKPQVQLSSADEAELFAADVSQEITPPQQGIVQSTDLSDQANRNRRLALVGDNREKVSDVLQKRAQEAVATLYARNNNVVYNVTPIFSEAA